MSPSAVSRTTRKRSSASLIARRRGTAALQNLANGVAEIAGQRFGLPRPGGAIGFVLAAAVSGHHQHSARAGLVSHFQVGIAVADYPRGAQVDGMFPRCPLQQARIRLAAIAGVLLAVR